VRRYQVANFFLSLRFVRRRGHGLLGLVGMLRRLVTIGEELLDVRFQLYL